MRSISSRPSRSRGGVAILPRFGDQGSHDQSLLHMAQQTGETKGGSSVVAVPLGGGSLPFSVPDPGASIEIGEIQDELAKLTLRLKALEEATTADPFGKFEVGDEPIPSGCFVTIKDMVLSICRSTSESRPVISGISMESGTPGQVIRVGILAGYRYELEVPLVESSGMIFLGPDGRPAHVPPSTGWFMEAGHIESSTTIYLDPDLAILRS